MSSPDKVLGTISALSTLIENFPMSILDLFQGKRYTSVFEFLIDVLQACGVPVDEAVEWILKTIFSIEIDVENGWVNSLNESLAASNFKNAKSSDFVRILDAGIKSILFTLLSSIYGCSTIPILPNKVMDYPDPSIFSGATKEDKKEKSKLWDAMWKYQIYPARFEIPAKLIDPMGMLEVSPTTNEGRIFYDVGGDDIYYTKKETSNPSASRKKSKSYITDIPLYFYTFNEDTNTWLGVKTDESVAGNINITIKYLSPKGNNLLKWDSIIKIGETCTDKHILFFKDNSIKIGTIKEIIINGCHNTCEIKNVGNCYISYEKSIDVINKYENYTIFNDIKWDNNSNVLMGLSHEEKEINNPYDKGVEDSGFKDSSEEMKYYIYEASCEKPENFKKAKRLSAPPTTASKDTPDLVVVYHGTNPNELYRTYDMNAFIWYVLNKSSRATQLDINHTMWDSRLKLYWDTNVDLEEDITKGNEWYNSKTYSQSEFLNVLTTGNNRIEKDANLYPILQLKKSANNSYGIDISFPAQRYYKRTYRNRVIKNMSNTDKKSKGKAFSFNSSIYQFNWEYLKSIQVLKPKILFTGFINYFIGGGLNEIANANITQQLIKNKLSNAVKKIIEADDTEIEDCYTSFSNDEFDAMLEDMLLSRYDMTYHNGINTKVIKHDVDSYLKDIDNISKSTDREGSVTKMKKLIEDVSVTPGEDGSVEFGFEGNINGAFILQKLIYSLAMPIVESLFTPQVMLLITINLSLTGLAKTDEFASLSDYGAILNFVFNKIMGLLKSIIKYIKDMIVEVIYKFILTKLLPLIIKWMAALGLEKLENWLNILTAAIKCLPTMELNFNRLNVVEDVNYADIINTGTTSGPEAATSC